MAALGNNPLVLRNYQSSDWDAVYDISEQTGDVGGDARLTFADPRLVPDSFAGPYLYLEPDLVFVLDNGQRPVGYVIGTADTNEFARAFAQAWLPKMAQRYQDRNEPPFASKDELFNYLLFHPEHMAHPEITARYPAHLHIDILPPYQGQGYGRQLIEAFVAAVSRAGAKGVHVTVDTANQRALAFYPRVGFAPFEVAGPPTGVVLFGRSW